MGKTSKLCLENGRVFNGQHFGYDGESLGEIVFNTSMTGYQEILTDPSYHSQVILMTYPHIGNYGINQKDNESNQCYAKGFIAREFCTYPSNFISEMSLEEYLIKNKVVGISNIDTRELTKIVRNQGAQRCIISSTEKDEAKLMKKIKDSPLMKGTDLTLQATCEEIYTIQNKRNKKNIFVYDYGCKKNILNILSDELKVNLTVGPSTTSVEEVKKIKPDGILLSNGPGDPSAASYAIDNIRNLLGFKPIFGICLGHQLLSLALGMKTFKLKFGHRGGNHPVMNLSDKKVEITSQNHGFAVTNSKIDNVKITHINLNDGTVEGIESKMHKCFSVQYHPEASPGPHDSRKYFKKFVEMI
ncbi:MAG: glutamine-hydrolyzing carbamoyl-phosphate synthase small subunit [Thermodesulfobacteriota bacterium]|nr:glutamine-hydrolyzing carbamoyl-phosphate synthase small subunit [Thermodesulfobacteriota bacterium]|tara:strand:+ start:800 stop:1873 length:1074 start_codon:yes stop_codon:yes gene_type:complete